MWAAETRARCDRRAPRYPGDLTDAERALIAPMIPPAKRGGRRREVAVLNGLLHVLETGCPWRHPPTDFRPVHGYFDLWAWDGTPERIHEALRDERLRVQTPKKRQSTLDIDACRLRAVQAYFRNEALDAITGERLTAYQAHRLIVLPFGERNAKKPA